MIFIILFAAIAVAGLLNSDDNEKKQIEKAVRTAKEIAPNASTINVQINNYYNCSLDNNSINDSTISINDFRNSEFFTRKQFNYLDQGLKYGIGNEALKYLNEPMRLGMIDSPKLKEMNDFFSESKQERLLRDLDLLMLNSGKKD